MATMSAKPHVAQGAAGSNGDGVCSLINGVSECVVSILNRNDGLPGDVWDMVTIKDIPAAGRQNNNVANSSMA